MKISMRFEGGAELAAQLNKLPNALSDRILVAALKEAAEPIRQRAQDIAPRGRTAPHIAENIVVGAVSSSRQEARGREGERLVEVGPELKPEDYFYGYFLEFGTRRMTARPFMRPAFDGGAPESLDILADELWFALKHGIDEFR